MKLLAACYTVLAIAAGARATVQLATRAGEAPVPYLLTAAAAVVYAVLAVCFHQRARRRRLALVAATVELVGVIGVGVLEASGAVAWPDETVWTGFGIGYGLAPLILPIAAISVLRTRLVVAAQ